MNYAVKYTKSDDGYAATFPDFPGLEAKAATPEETQSAAYEALISKLMSFMENGLPVPLPQEKPNPAYISLLASVPPKILLHNLVVSQNKSRSWVAAQMGVTRQVMTRLFNLRESTKVETIQNALDTLGYEMFVTIEPKPQNFQF
ncbi:type II toxin-antitoxin system HicB family antitoxin [Salmonella enterica]|nr:type II toxin-antitoxin system HicB family antitoxin [Salmonella enterica]